MLKIGQFNQFTVKRKTDIGYMLTIKDEEVFLHFNESGKQELNPEDSILAFVYIDGYGRTAATLAEAKLTTEKPSFLTVKDINPKLGVFLDMGINKDLLLSKEDLPFEIDQWPQINDKLLVCLKIKGKMVAKRPNKSELMPTDAKLQIKQTYDAYIHRFSKDGIQVITEDQFIVFVHNSQINENYHLGQKVEVKVIFESEKGLSGTLIPQKEEQMLLDANKIYAYLLKVNSMPLTSNSTPEEIEKIFNISKKAFKRAIGHLYKERKILFDDEKTWIVS